MTISAATALVAVGTGWADVQPGATLNDLDRLTVRDVMIGRPKTLEASATVGEVRAAFGNDHVHVMLLTEGRVLRGTVIREDLVGTSDDTSALAVSTLDGRTIAPAASMQRAHQVLADTDARRLAVIDDGGALLGLLCLKRRRNGYCSEADLASREGERSRGFCDRS